MYFESGLGYFGQQRFEEASIQFRNSVEKEPRAWAAHYYLALIALKLQRWQDAYKELNTVIELQPSFHAARLDLAELLLSAHKTNEARDQLNIVQAVSASSVRAQALLAKIYLLEGDYSRAVQEFEKAKQLVPEDSGLWLACGLAKVSANQLALAEKDFRRAIELAPGAAEAYRNLANLFRLAGRTAEVEPILRQGITVSPRSLDLYLALADFDFQQGHLHEINDLFSEMERRAADFPNLRVALGDFWIWRSELARAVKEYEVALAQASTPVVQKKLISAYLSMGRWDEAEALTQRVLAHNPKDLEGRSFRGALRHLRGDSTGAVGELQAALKEEPKSPFTNYYLGLALMALGRSDEASAAFLECVRYDANFPQAFQRLAELHLQRQDWGAALEYAKKVVALVPRRPDGYLLVAQALLYKGEAHEAEQVLRQVQRQMAPDSPDVHELLGVAFVKKGNVEAGLKEYQQAWARDPNPDVRLSRFADLLIARGRPDAGLRPVQQLIASNPQASYYEILARLYAAKDDPESAEAACQKALRLDSSRWLSYLYLGDIYLRLHRQAEALGSYEEVMRRQPKLVSPYILAGDIYLRQGRLDQARTYYEIARKLDPQSALAEHRIARLWAEEGSHLDEALAAIQSLQQRLADDPNLSDTLGWVYYRRGQYSLALPLLKRCAEHQPKNALFRFHLGMTYAKAGNTNLSRRELQSALRLGLESARWEDAAQEVLTHF